MKPMKPFAGKWRIVEMEIRDQDYVDMEVPGYIRIGSDGTGRFQFAWSPGTSMAGWSNAVMRHVSIFLGLDMMKTIRSAVAAGQSLKMAS